MKTATLHALPAFAAWARARGFRVGDKALDADGRDFLVVQVYDDKFTGIWGVHMCDDLKAADCRLMASESDLWDYLQTRCHRVRGEFYADGGYIRLENPDSFFSNGVAIGYSAVAEGDATTRIGALVAAVEAVGGE